MYRYEILLVVLRQGGFRIGPACSARVSRRHFRAFLSRAHEAALFLALRFALPGESVVNRQGRSVVSAEKNCEVCRRAEIGSESGFGCGTEIGGSPETKKGHGLEKSSPFLPNREAQLFPFRPSVPRYVDIGRSRCSKSSAPPAKGASRIVRALCRRRAADDSRARETGTGQVRFSDVLAANGTEKRIPCDSRPDRLFGEIAKERRRGRRALSTVRP